jgi:hypothetical protein
VRRTSTADTAERQGKHGSTTARCGYRPAHSIRHDTQFNFSTHQLEPGGMLVGHQPCRTCRGGHTTWTCLACGAVVYGPALTADCRVLVAAAPVR